MTLKIYGIKNCNTMKKTFDFLKENGIEYIFIDYKKQAPDASLLLRFASKVGFEALVNKKGTTYKKLTDEEKSLLEKESDALALLGTKSSMIKRPIVEFPNGDLILGFEPEAILKKI
ncbi:Spx/MgsR family RNA polymerase-binding regulatory protein [Aquiflexum gelatinilyticum]|uniref:Spx/MgsR family RNA polymerase-binding regulatory protein n=1 Tax=Aquiflexum gelatinilyticum TaxID=2961943 RepID=A0A9X2T2X2_9BACT|nr:Spx/MgsR family RNA polymerase-binding regulatory protein [Aquiflexum gelatinilyticum]MCR9017196.1 Spx/MgsR family RNA polymerase-binding regulatory protein [Aquiflexum gelatinilyticum]